jgi:hypothetical protein
MADHAAVSEWVVGRMLAGTPVTVAQLPCSCGAADAGSDAHYADCAIARVGPVGFDPDAPTRPGPGLERAGHAATGLG